MTASSLRRPEHSAAGREAAELRDLAWAFLREQHEAFADPDAGRIGQMCAAVELLRDADEYDPGSLPDAHSRLLEVVIADIRECGFVYEDAVPLLLRTHQFLTERHGLKWDNGRWSPRSDIDSPTRQRGG